MKDCYHVSMMLFVFVLMVNGSEEIIQLEMHCPWVEHLFALENKLSVSPSIKYVLYQEKESEKWRVQVIILL